MSKHKALELADSIDSDAFAERIGNNLGREAAAELRSQHALIVQMREAFSKCKFDSLNMSVKDWNEVCNVCRDADQYLGEQA